MKLSAFPVLIAVSLLSNFSHGDVVSWNVGGLVVAELENETARSDNLVGDMQSSELLLRGNGNHSTKFSQTTSSLNYNWDGTRLTGTGLIDAEKVKTSENGGLHQGESTLTFDFTISETSNYFLAGNYGYVGVTTTGETDSVSWTLTGIPVSGPSYFASGTANTVSDVTVNEQLFSASDTISAGTYRLVMTADFHETVAGLESRQAGWQITSFTVPTVSVPESGSFVVVGCLALMALRRRRSQ